MKKSLVLSFLVLLGFAGWLLFPLSKKTKESFYRFQYLAPGQFLSQNNQSFLFSNVHDEHSRSLFLQWLRTALQILPQEDGDNELFVTVMNNPLQGESLCDSNDGFCGEKSIFLEEGNAFSFRVNGKETSLSSLAEKNLSLAAQKNNEIFYNLGLAEAKKGFDNKNPAPVLIQDQVQFLKDKVDLTHGISFGPSEGRELVWFCDFFSSYCRQQLPLWSEFLSHQKTWRAHLILFFPSNDPLETVVGEFFYCLKHYQPDAVLGYLKNFEAMDPLDPEKFLFGDNFAGMDSAEGVKKCYLQREMQEVLQFSLDTSRYHGVLGTPTFVIEDKPFTGPMTIEALGSLVHWPKR